MVVNIYKSLSSPDPDLQRGGKKIIAFQYGFIDMKTGRGVLKYVFIRVLIYACINIDYHVNLHVNTRTYILGKIFIGESIREVTCIA